MLLEDPDRILELLRDPNVASQEVADQTGLPRTEAARAARLLVGLAKARPEEIATLPPPLAGALMKAAITGERLDVLTSLAASADKTLAKEAKRALHVLRTRGVALPEAPRAATPAPAPAAEELFPCYASLVDGQGERAIWVARNVPGRGVEVGQAVVSDLLGIVELQLGVLGRKEYRIFGKEIGERGRTMGVREIDPAHARAIVAAARRQNDVSGKLAPDGTDAWLGRIGPGSLPPDPSVSLPALSEEEERGALAASAELHTLPVLRGWLADETALRALAVRLDEMTGKAGIPDPAERTVRMKEEIASALEAWLSPACRERLSARLLDVAVHLVGTGDAARGAQAAAAARALKASQPGREIPFVREMVEKAFPGRGSSAASAARPVIGAPRP